MKLADLMNEPWALPSPDSRVGPTNAAIFRAAGLDLPATTVVCSNGAARIALVAEGRFLTIASESVFKLAGRDMTVKALPVNLPQVQRPVGIVTLKNRSLTPVAELFIDCARETAKLLAKDNFIAARRSRVHGK